MEMDNKTKRERARVHFETRLVAEYGGKTQIFQRTFDVSMNGVFVKTAKPFPLNASFRFALILSFGMRREEIKGICEVVRVVSIDEGLSEAERGPGMGLKFSNLDAGSGEILFHLIRYNQAPE